MEVHYAYAMYMNTLTCYTSDPAEVSGWVAAIKPFLADPNARSARPAFDYWLGAYDRATAATTAEDIKDIARRYFCTGDENNARHFNVAQALMKATTHLLWKKLYRINNPDFPADKVPPMERAAAYFLGLCADIATENGETLDAMAARICH